MSEQPNDPIPNDQNDDQHSRPQDSARDGAEPAVNEPGAVHDSPAGTVHGAAHDQHEHGAAPAEEDGSGGQVLNFRPRPTVPHAPDEDTGEDDEERRRTPVDPPAAAVSSAEVPWAREVARRPIIAPWLTRTEDVRAAVRWATGWAWHATGFHTVRTPLYALRLAVRSPRGLAVLVARIARWSGDSESRPLREQAVRAGETDQWLRLEATRAERVRRRRLQVAAGALAAVAGGVAVVSLVPGWLVVVAAGAGLLVLGWVGTPVDRPITGASVIRNKPTRLTSEIVIRALGALGLSEINKAMGKGGTGITFPAPITRDGPGWRADVDLPYGVTAVDVIERRDRLASGLRRPLGCVWPEPVHDEHTGRLVIWAGDQDMSQAKPKPWPLASHGSVDLFKPVPFGADQRGRPVTLLLMFSNVLIGAMPRVGKTFALRVLLLACALDPAAQLRVFELKGTGDLSPLEGCCHAYGSGADDATLESAMESLRELYAELNRRAKRIRDLPREVCPENKVTPQISGRRDLGLFPIVLAIDECQELFSHPDFKDEADRLATGIIKRGPAMGIILILATQRPDARSLPTGVSANVGIRFCLRVMGQTENDMVLGTSAYRNGIRATTFTQKDKGIGYLLGAADDPQIVRSAYLDAPAAEAIAARARGLREAAGTLSGHAVGETPGAEQRGPRSVLGDVAAVFNPGEDRLWSDVIAARLAEQWPTTYVGTSPASLAALLKPYGLKPAQVWGADPQTGEGRNRRGYLRDAITTAWETTERRRRATGEPSDDGPADVADGDNE